MRRPALSEETAQAFQRVQRAPAASAHDVLLLQRALGNQVVQRLLAGRQAAQQAPQQAPHRAHIIQRMRMNPTDGHYYSGATPVMDDAYKFENENDAFLSVTSNLKVGGGHTAVYIEYLDGNRPRTVMTDLRVAGAGGSSDKSSDVTVGAQGSTKENSSGSGKGSGKIQIAIEEMAPGLMAGDLATRGAGGKKSWKKSRGEAQAGLAHAQDVQNKVQSSGGKAFKYYLLGRGPAKGAMNCARFGQHILKKAGVPIHLGFFKLPSKLTKKSKKDQHIETVKSVSDMAGPTDSKLPEAAKSQGAFMAAVLTGQPDPFEGKYGYDALGKNLERYHRFTEPVVRFHPLKNAIGALTAIMQIKALRFEAGQIPGNYNDDAAVQFVSGQFVPGLVEEMVDYRQAVTEQLELNEGGQEQDEQTPEPGFGLAGILPKLDPMVAYLENVANAASSGALKEQMAERFAGREREGDDEETPGIDPGQVTPEQLLDADEAFKFD